MAPPYCLNCHFVLSELFYLALIALLGFIVVLVGNIFYMLRKKCPACPIKDDCHSGFAN
jgi:hypothetical protein